MNFLELGLSEQTVRAIEEFGIQEPTTVQSDVIPSILEGKDVFTIAPQGCGKTMSYVFPLVDIISTKGAQNILIITPNSEQSVITSDRLAILTNITASTKPQSKTVRKTLTTKLTSSSARRTCWWKLSKTEKLTFPKPIFWWLTTST